MQRATFTLTEQASADRRTVRVSSTAQSVAEPRTRVETWPQAAAVCDDVLRAVDVAYLVLSGRTIDPAPALDRGLVDEVTEHG